MVGTPFSPRTIDVVDQFTTRKLELRKVDRLCTPASKNGSAIKDPARHLLCYAVRPVTRPPSPVFANNQFGPDVLNLGREGAYCVPSSKTVISTESTTTVTTSTTTTTMAP